MEKTKDGVVLAFGLRRVIPPDARAYWGCRMIATLGPEPSLDFVFDRQDGGGKDFTELTNRMKASKAFHHLRCFWANNAYSIHGKEEPSLVYEDGDLKIWASTNVSYGYLYVSAYLEANDEPE